MFDLNREVQAWTDQLRAKGGLSEDSLQELQDHLRDQHAELCRTGLSGEEAFLVAVRRTGNLDAIASELAQGHEEAVWKQFVVARSDPLQTRSDRRDLGLIIGLVALAALLSRLPLLLFPGSNLESPEFLRNLFLFFVPLIGVYFSVRQGRPGRPAILALVGYALLALAVNLFPQASGSATAQLTIYHLPLAVWLLTLLPYAGPLWRQPQRRMDFIRLSGETFIFTVLILLGIGVLVAFTGLMFQVTGMAGSQVLFQWMMPMLACAAPVLGLWLADHKKSVVENLAPLLARIFSPLFLVVELAFLVALLASGVDGRQERTLLISFDLLLAMSLALSLYLMAARQPRQKSGFFEAAALGLVLVSLAANLIALGFMGERILSNGLSPNKLAAVGENLLLFANLGGLAFWGIRAWRHPDSHQAMVRFQTGFLPLYFIWFLLVVLVFPPLFGFA